MDKTQKHCIAYMAIAMQATLQHTRMAPRPARLATATIARSDASTGRLRWLLPCLALLCVVLVAVRQWADDGFTPVPGITPGSTPVRQVFDLLEPRETQLSSEAAPITVPGAPLRYLVARLDAGVLLLGWSGDPGEDPADTVRLAATGATMLEGYCDLHRDSAAVLHVWRGFGPGPGSNRIDITWKR